MGLFDAQDPGGFGYVTRHAYDENGNETKLTDPKGQTVVTSYDELNRQKTKAYAFAPAASVGPFIYTGVVFASLIDWLLWGTLPDRYSVIGAFVVVGAAVLALRLRHLDDPLE